MENVSRVEELGPIADLYCSAGSAPNCSSSCSSIASSCCTASAGRGPSPEHFHHRRLSLAKKRASVLLEDANFCLKYPSVAKALKEFMNPLSLSSASSSDVALSVCSSAVPAATTPQASLLAAVASGLEASVPVFASSDTVAPLGAATAYPSSVTASLTAAVPEIVSSSSHVVVSPSAASAGPRLFCSGHRDCVAASQRPDAASAGHLVSNAFGTNASCGTAAAGGKAATGTAGEGAIKQTAETRISRDIFHCSVLPPQCVSNGVASYQVAAVPTAYARVPTVRGNAADNEQRVALDNQMLSHPAHAPTYFANASRHPAPTSSVSPRCQLPTTGLAAVGATNAAARAGLSQFSAADKQGAAAAAASLPDTAGAASSNAVTPTAGITGPTSTAATSRGAAAAASAGALHDVPPGRIASLSPAHAAAATGVTAATERHAADACAWGSHQVPSLGGFNESQVSTRYPRDRLTSWPPLSRAPTSSFLCPFFRLSDADLCPSPFSLPANFTRSQVGSQRPVHWQPHTFSSFAASANGIRTTAAAGGECNLRLRPRASTPDLRQLVHARDDSDDSRVHSGSFTSSICRPPAAQQFVRSVCLRATPPSSVRGFGSAEGGDSELLQQRHHSHQRAEKLDAASWGQSGPGMLQQQPQLKYQRQDRHRQEQSEHLQQHEAVGNSGQENRSVSENAAVVTEAPASQYIPPGVRYRSRLFTNSHAGATHRAEDAEASHGDAAEEKGEEEEERKEGGATSEQQQDAEADQQLQDAADVDGLPGQTRRSGRAKPADAATGTFPPADAISDTIAGQIPGPPQHFARRFEGLRRRYEAALRAANTVEYQYRLFRSLDRPQPLVRGSAVRSYPFLPSTPRPGTLFAHQHEGMLSAARGLSFPVLKLYQQRNAAEGISASAPPQHQPPTYSAASASRFVSPATGAAAADGAASSAGHLPRRRGETAAARLFEQTTRPAGGRQVTPSPPPPHGPPRPLQQQQRQQRTLQHQAAEAAAAAARAGNSSCMRDWKGFGPVVKDGIVNPAIVMEKQLMDEALCHMQYECVALQQQSRELELRLTDQQQEAQDKLWRRIGVREALCDINQEQQAFLKEQLRALDQTRSDLQTMQDEAARMERRARDMFYRKLYTSTAGEEDEEVQRHKEQIKTLEQLRRQLPSTAALEATISHFISSCSSTSALLNRLEESGLATAAEQLSPETCGKAVDTLLKRMGFEERSGAVPVRRGDGLPAQYYSRFPELYPHPEFNEGLPRSQQALRERLHGLEAKGEPTSFSTAVERQKQQQHRRADIFLSTVGTKPSAGAGKEELVQQQLLQQQQQQKQQLDQDWEEFFRSKREAKEIEQAQRAAEQARQDAVKAVEEAQQAVELLARRQRVMESEAAAAERKAAAEREAAAAAERRAEAEKQAAEEAAAAAAAAEELLRQQRLRRAEQKAAEEEERQRQASRLKEPRHSASREVSAAGEEGGRRRDLGGEARRLYSRRTETGELGSQSYSKRQTLTVEAAQDLAREMRRKESIVSGVPSVLRHRSLSVATRRADKEPHGLPEAAPRGREATGEGGAATTAAGATAGGAGKRGREEARGKAVERQPSQYLGMHRTLTMHKTPLSRSLSASVAPDAERLLLDTTTEHQTLDDQKEIKELQPPDRLLLSAGSKRFAVYAHVQRREKTELIGDSPFAKRLPYNKCEVFVLLEPPDSRRLQHLSPFERYKDVKELLASGQLGLKENAQDVYDFAVSCCHRAVRGDPRSQEYANVLIEAIPYYPYQIDIQRAGIIALLNIFEHCKYQEQLAVPLFECLTTLLAIEDAELRGDIVAVMAAAIRPQVSVNSEVVDLLLQLLQASADAAVCCYCLHVLLVGRSPHHKGKQYALFVRLLEKWKFDPVVPTRACLAVDAFARRAVQEELAAHERRKRECVGLLSQQQQQRQQQPGFPSAGEGGAENLSYGLDLYRRGSSFPIEAQVLENVEPPAWMTPTREDVEKIVLVMERHPQHRRLQGAASQALASLAAASLSHSEAIADKGVPQMKTAALNHKESQTIAGSICSLVALLAALPSCRHALNADFVDFTRQLLVRHRAVAEVVASACAALAKLDALYPLSDEILDRVTLAIVLNNLRNAADQPAICVSIAELLQRVAPRYEELAGTRNRLVELDAVEAILKVTTACSSSVEVCEVSCKAISHLVYRQEESSEVYVQLVKYRAITSFLFVLLKHHRHATFCREALSCIANCCVHPSCADAIMERGLNVICKAISANIKDMEVVAQGCRCLRCISAQPALHDAVSHRAASIISFAAEQFSSRLDTRALVTEFLTDILHGRGVRPQTLEPLWSGAAAAARSSAAVAHSSTAAATRD